MREMAKKREDRKKGKKMGKVICYVVAAVCFFVKGLGVNTGQIDLMNIGFGVFTISLLV